MTAPIWDTPGAGASATRQVTHLQKVANNLYLEALNEAYSKRAPDQPEISLKQLLQRHDFFRDFKDNLAKGVAQTLARHDKRVQAVYLFEPSPHAAGETNASPPLEATLHLLVLVEAPSAALDAFVSALDQGLMQCLAEVSAPVFPEGRLLLDVNLVTPEAVERGTGLASLLSSTTAPPFKLWERSL